jgi:hypothetical protein
VLRSVHRRVARCQLQERVPLHGGVAERPCPTL